MWSVTDYPLNLKTVTWSTGLLTICWRTKLLQLLVWFWFNGAFSPPLSLICDQINIEKHSRCYLLNKKTFSVCTGEKVDRVWILVIQLDVWAFNYHEFSQLFQWIYKGSSIFSLCVNELHCVFHDVIWLDSGCTDFLFSKTYWLYSTVYWG